MGRTACVLLAVFALLFASVELGLAKRLGGGGSMGNRQSFSTSTTPRPDAGSPSGSFSSQQARPNPTAATPGGGMFSRPGLGGMLGGLLVGGLVGSMLFGGGHGWGGPSLLDMLLIGGGLFLLFRFMRSRRTATAQGPSFGQPMSRSYEAEPQSQAQQAAAGGWNNLGAAAQATAPAGPDLPPGFDAADFLAGAKALFARMQQSWSKRDLADIEAFATPAFMADVRKQAAEDPTPAPTDVLLVDAKLLEVRSQGGATIASAYFDVLMREDPKAGQPEQVREVWHFTRKETVPGDAWKLDAIQQLDA
ncbi:Tim44 domain-containing protein [Solidesulfovibrio magneticus]|uniref:Tim44 domain-containing protein n=1 Tax=Solidesulfovibrio magneticus TaxID=184917 RepID=UPI0011D17500|nr:Tim44-like domain-containing protein [Solidesulfovibrio magneticus]